MKNKTLTALVMLALLSSTLLVMAGCHSDPHDTHIQTSVTAPQ